MHSSSRRSSNETLSVQLTGFLFLYFLQGLPFGLQTRFLPIQLRLAGMSLTTLGYFRALLTPWVLKGLYAPIIDRTGNLYMWLNASHLTLIFLSALASQFPPENLVILGFLLLLIHLSVAVQDIALDSLLIELLTPSQLVSGNMVQVVGYKVGAIVSGGFFGFLNEYFGWATLFYVLAFFYFLGYIVSAFFLPPEPEQEGSLHFTPTDLTLNTRLSMVGFDDTNSVPLELSGREAHLGYTHSLIRLFEIDGTIWLFPFVFVYKFGDQGVSSLFPMFLLDKGMDAAEVSFWSGCVGQIFSLSGSVLGGYIRNTMIESIQILLLVQAISLLTLWAAVIFWNDSALIYVGSLLFQMIAYLASGGVTTCTFTLIMQLSKTVPRRIRTSHYTLLATSEVAGRIFAGTVAGALTDHTSYSFTFGLLSVASVIIVPYSMTVPEALVIES